MSAYIEDKAHIDALVAVAVRGPSAVPIQPDRVWHGPRWNRNTDGPSDYISVGHVAEADKISADELGQMLWAENVRSIQSRYPDTIDNPANMPGPCDFLPAEVLVYSWPFNTPRLTAVDALQALFGYEYQACEHPGWHTSEAKRFCDALRNALCMVLTHESRCWSIDADTLANYGREQVAS